MNIDEALDLLKETELINQTALRNYKIKAEFDRRRNSGEKSKSIIASLTESYCLSESSINAIVYTGRLLRKN